MEAPVELSTASNSHLNPTIKVEVCMLPRKDCVTSNRFRTDVRECNLARWERIN